jgi:hypothetical protein
MDTEEEAVCPFVGTSFVDFVWINAKLDPKWIGRPTTFTTTACAESVDIEGSISGRSKRITQLAMDTVGVAVCPFSFPPFVNTCLTKLESADCEWFKALLICKSLGYRVTQLAMDTVAVAVCPFSFPPFVNTCLTKLESIDWESSSVAMTRHGPGLLNWPWIRWG